MFDVEKIRGEFPILGREVYGKPLVYLDNGATAQKPLAVIETIDYLNRELNANIHRGVHYLSEEATTLYEASRERIRAFIGAAEKEEVIFTAGATASLNTVAYAWGEKFVRAGDNIVVSEMEHHSNIIPWQEACKKTGAKLVYAYLKDGQLDMEDLVNKITEKTKFVSLAQVSNVLGCINPVKEIAKLAHQVGAYMVVDGAQSAPHMVIDVQDLDCDFFTLSGHKMLGPTGIGVLYGKEEILNQMNPIEFGGEMIDFVYEQEATWKELPWKFEAGTPNIAGAIALGAAVDYLSALGMENVHAYEQELVDYVLPKLHEIEGLTVYGPDNPSQHAGVIAFNIDGLHPHDVATALDYEGVAVRAGHHCAQPLINHLGISSAARASFYIFNTKEDCDKLVEAILATKEFFNGTL